MRPWVLVAGLSLGLAGCTTSMTASTLIDQPSGLGCSSAAGSYYLPKTLLKVVVKRYEAGPGANHLLTGPATSTFYKLEGVTPVAVPDRKQGYCLDYIASPTTDEKVWVKTDEKQLLSQISTQAIDKSGYILKTLISAVFRGIAGVQGAAFRAGETDRELGLAFSGEYDPFDVEQSAIVNNTLSALGFCLVLEGHTLDLSRDTIDAYCSDPSRALAGRMVSRRPSQNLDKDAAPSEGVFRQPPSAGVLYRPRVPHNYYLFVRHLERGQVKWKLRQTATVLMENRAPIISVGVDRSFFALRRTALLFEKGVLKNVCIYKSSELEEFAQIPLFIVDQLAELPTNILMLKVTNTNNYKNLVDTQKSLIETQRDHLKVIRGSDPTRGNPTDPSQWKNATQSKVTTPQDVTVAASDGEDPKKDPSDWDKLCAGGSVAQGKFIPTDVETSAGSLTPPNSTIFQKDAPK
jgi:hypothetical protein